ncbi:C2H2-type domain-containing protein [Fusarium sp. LHS14.1]|nr:C2H2-type domain-containing protein [Fusarium sp. LHS14.1]
MEAFPTKAGTPSLFKSFGECIRLFRSFLLALHDESCRVVRLKQVDVTEISDECGRAKIWGDQMRADLPERARGSLDDALRHDSDIKGLVEAIFIRLSGLLRQAKSIAERKYDPLLGPDHDSISSVSADDSDSGSGSYSDSDTDSDDDGQPRPKRMPKICLLVRQIADQIRSLYDLSSLLRRPRIADKYIRSVGSKSCIATSDTLPLMVSFNKLDESHVIEKVLQWRGLTKSGQSFSCENETPIQERHSLATDGVGDILWYCQRLARANTRRREQLQHWVNHPYVSTQDKSIPARPLPLLVRPLVKGSETKEESGSQVSTLKPTSFKFPFAGPKSTMSKQSFSTAAVSDVRDTKTNTRSRTVYAPTNVGQGRSNAVPDLPKTDGQATFPCPYCEIPLESSEMQNRQSWKRHVFRDLRPYICTFEHCQNPEKLYVSRHEWIYHELQIHRRKYICKDCPKTYYSRTEMSAHVQGHYGESISPAQLGVILDLCNQQDDGMNGEKDECLICGEELSFLALQRHLATHMEDMALFVLPSTQKGQDMGETNDSVQAELESKGQLSDIKSQISSLGFSTTGDHGQTGAEFSKLLAREEEGYSFKFTHWKLNDDPEVASLQALVQQLNSPDEKVRQDAVEALGSQPALPYEIIESMGSNLECRDRYGQTVLLQATRKGHEVTFERLIEKGADFETRDEDGWSPLRLAANFGNEAIVRILVKVGADLESRDEYGNSPLHIAANYGHAAIVEMLLEKGADFNSSDLNGHSPLHGAANDGHEAVVKMLLEKGADSDCRSMRGNSSLHYAAKNGNEAVVRMLLKMGADNQMMDKNGDTPLSLAIMRGHEAIIQLLQQHVDSPASHQSSDAYHSTPHDARDVTADISLTEIHVDSLPPLYKKVTQDWHAVFNPQVQRDLDVDLVHVFEHPTDIRSVRFSHDGMYIATGSRRRARIFDIQTGKLVSDLDHNGHLGPHPDRCLYVRSVSFSPDGHCLATDIGNMVYLWDIKSRTILARLQGHESEVRSTEFSLDGRSIASGSVDGTVRLWDVDSRTNTRTFAAGNIISSVAFSPNMRLIASGSEDASIKVWETSTGALLARLEGAGGYINSVLSVAFSPDGETLVSAFLDRTIKMWHLATPIQSQSPWRVKYTKTLQGHEDPVSSVAFTPDGNGLLSGSLDRRLQFWDPKTGMVQFMLRAHRDFIYSIAVSPRGGIFATASADREVRVWSYGPYQAEGT